MIGLSHRVHLFAHPSVRVALTEFFTSLFGCDAVAVPGAPVVAFRFADGASVSVDFTADAPSPQQAGRGAWLEVTTDKADALKQAVLAAGLPTVSYFTGRFYFVAPGGQVWGILDASQHDPNAPSAAR